MHRVCGRGSDSQGGGDGCEGGSGESGGGEGGGSEGGGGAGGGFCRLSDLPPMGLKLPPCYRYSSLGTLVKADCATDEDNYSSSHSARRAGAVSDEEY
jgi:hypothetical protein